MGRVRAYVGLGANVGRPDGDARRGGPRARGACPGCGCAACRGCTPRSRSASLDQPEFRNAVVALDVPAGPRPGDRRLGAARRAQGRSSARSAASSASAGGRARSTSTCSCSGATGSTSSGRPRAGADDPAKASLPLVVPHVEARHRLFVLAPLVGPGARARAAGLGRDRRDGRRHGSATVEGPDAARPIATWDGDGWAASARLTSPHPCHRLGQPATLGPPARVGSARARRRVRVVAKQASSARTGRRRACRVIARGPASNAGSAGGPAGPTTLQPYPRAARGPRARRAVRAADRRKARRRVQVLTASSTMPPPSCQRWLAIAATATRQRRLGHGSARSGTSRRRVAPGWRARPRSPLAIARSRRRRRSLRVRRPASARRERRTRAPAGRRRRRRQGSRRLARGQDVGAASSSSRFAPPAGGPGDGTPRDPGQERGHAPPRAARHARPYSRTAGGRSRSNMWTVSTNRTCLVW